ncbi:lipase family protein [Helicobacter bilis]|nr:Mbeg1-like protein [Helicobacter bilis]
MKNKEMINRLKDNAELAMAAYGYFHLADSKYDFNKDNTDTERLEYFRELKDDKTQSLFPTPTDILNIEYKYFKDNNGKPKDSWYHKHFLGGDFSPLQSKRFFEKYDLLKHCPNTESGFSATLFQNKETKEYTLAIRGTELKLSQAWQDIITTDGSLLLSSTPLEQYNDMLRFYNQCKTKYPKIKIPNSLTLTGHSLGGCLAQLLALSLCDDKNRNNIKALYTYNAPGARKIAPHYDYIVKLFAFHSKEQQEKFIKEEIENIANRARDLGKNNISLESKIREILHKIIQEKHSQYYGITMSISTHTTTMMLNINAVPILADIAQCYETLAYNYTQHFKEDRNTPQNFKLKGDERYTYKLSIQDSIYHCESSNNEYKNKWYMDSPISKLGIKLGLHQDNQYSDTTLLHTINTGSGTTGDHSIIPLTQTLYFYSYLLELDSNNTMLESKLQSNNDKERLSEYLYTLNVFMKNIKTAMNILIHEIDKKNKEKYEKFKKQMKWYQSTPNYDSIDYLALFISQVNELAFKIETLKEDNNKYFTSSIDIHTIIDTILKLQEHNYLIEIIDNDKLRAMRNQCKADNKASITEKLSLETCQPFRLVDKNTISYLNENNLHQIFGYKDLGHILSQEWHEEYINGRYEIAKGLYFGGNTISSLSKYAKDKELRIS